MHVNEMTDEQRAIVNYNDNLIVTAAPGSGKTKTLIDKVEKLASNANNEHYIIAITYTYRAAEEIADRLEVRNIDSNHVWSGTIHRFCLEFVIHNYSQFMPKYCRGFEILDEYDLLHIAQKIDEEQNLNTGISNFNRPNFTINIDGTYNEKRNGFSLLVSECYKYLDSNGLISFDQILYETYIFLKGNKFTCDNIAFAINWLIIDEYQDTKDLQYHILSLIASSNTKMKLMFVGDPNQAIYRNLDGVYKDKQELEKLFNRNFKVKRLSGCFRSNQKIIDFYKNFACYPEEIVSKTNKYLFPHISYSKNIVLKNEFPEFVLKSIRFLADKKIPYEEICVMVPHNNTLFALSSYLRKHAPEVPIDAPVIAPLKKMDDSVWNSLGRLIFTKINFSNIRKCERILRSALYELRCRYNIQYTQDTYYKVLDYLIKTPLINEDTGTIVLESRLRFIFDNLLFIDKYYYEKPLLELIEATKRKISINLFQLNDTVECFVSCYKEKSGVILSTCHGCKGEEYRAVIVGGINEGLIPHHSNLNNRFDAKTLLYVIFSRAKEILIISSEKPWNDGNHFPTNELISLDYNYDIF